MPLYEKLDDCQRKAVRLGIRRKCACIFFEQGVGKTHPMVSLIEELMDDNFVGFGVVLLSNIETTWLRLIRQVMPKLKIYNDWPKFKEAPRPKLFLTNYESIDKDIKTKMGKFKWTLGWFDESQRLKARGTNSSRLGAAIKHCEYRFALSGTPTDGEELHLFGQLRFVVPSLYGNDRSAWTRFDQRFLKPTGYMGYKRKFRKEMLPVFYEETAPYIIRVEASEALDLPKMTTELVPVTMLGNQAEVYNKMEHDSVVHVAKMEKKARELKANSKILSDRGDHHGARVLSKEARRVTAGLRITQMIKLQQICGGYVVDDDGETHYLGSAKIRKLKHILKRKARWPVVIFCKYTEEREAIEKLVESLKLRYRSIHGGIRDKKNHKARTEAQDLFQSGKLDVMVCQVRAGGVGIDLFKAKTGIFYSTTFSFIDFDQCRKRIHRRGQVNETTLYFLYAENSIDEDIYSTILSKRSVSKQLFNGIKKRNLPHGKRTNQSQTRKEKSRTRNFQVRYQRHRKSA